jgi:hypothetical protein
MVTRSFKQEKSATTLPVLPVKQAPTTNNNNNMTTPAQLPIDRIDQAPITPATTTLQQPTLPIIPEKK